MFRFKIHLAPGHGLERHYYIKLGTAPGRFRFTSGVCNDDEKGWECDYPDQRQLVDSTVENVTETAKGIRWGRSPGCIFVDKHGKVSSLVDFGVMREGDTLSLGTDIDFVMEFDDNVAATGTRRLGDAVIDEEDDGLFVTTRYLLADQEKFAIGTVTAEVLAATLDARLAEKGIELESVNPKDVTFSDKSSVSSGTSVSQLAVNMEIRASKQSAMIVVLSNYLCTYTPLFTLGPLFSTSLLGLRLHGAGLNQSRQNQHPPGAARIQQKLPRSNEKGRTGLQGGGLQCCGEHCRCQTRPEEVYQRYG